MVGSEAALEMRVLHRPEAADSCSCLASQPRLQRSIRIGATMRLSRRSVAAAITAGAFTGFSPARPGSGRAQMAPPARPVVASLVAEAPGPKLMAARLQGFRDVGLEEGRDFDLLSGSTENDLGRAVCLV